MNSDTDFSTKQKGFILRRTAFFRHLAQRDNTPFGVLLLSALVGTLAGFAGVAFDKSVSWIEQNRIGFVARFADDGWLVWPIAFICSALLAMFGYFLVRRFAPEAGGSGIPEIEGALEGVRPVRWMRVLPVKFFGGLGTLGAGMVLGREGPTVQMGGSLGQMVFELFRLKNPESRHTLLSSGAGAGLAAAFNAPLAGILFVIEEMRPHFHYNLISIKAVFIGVIMSCTVYRVFNGNAPLINVGNLGDVPLSTLWIYLVLGMTLGIVGVIFNRLVIGAQDFFQRIHGGNTTKWILVGGFAGGVCGLLALTMHAAAGGGFELIPIAAEGNYATGTLLLLLAIRILTTLLCFSSGAPGGIFAPLLALGTLCGTVFGSAAIALFPEYHLNLGLFALAGMTALLSATLRAPLTAMLLVLEMTTNYQLILPLLLTCVGATMLAQLCGGQPLYSQILARTLAKQEAQQQADAAKREAQA